MARAAPSGTRGSARGDEPRTRRALARAECQKRYSCLGHGTESITT